MTEKEVFIKNRHRELQSKLGGQREAYQPEHERLNKTPNVHDVQEDFRYARRRPLVVTSGSNEPPRPPEPPPQPPPQQTGYLEPPPHSPPRAIASGHNEELSWLPRPVPNYTGDPNVDVIGYEDVPEPPPAVVLPEEVYQPHHVVPKQVPEPEQEPQRAVSIDDIADGHYFVVVMDSIIAESPELDDIEEFVERMVFDSQNSIELDDIVVLRKLKIKVGVSVG